MKQLKKTKQQPKVKIYALGGLGEVGKNTYVLEQNNEILIIDAGIMFPGQKLLGVDYVIPDYTHLIENQHKIKALIITHGHEDHIGGIPFMLRQLKIPKIYAPKLALALIKNKLKEHTLSSSTNIEPIGETSFLKFKNFKVSFVRTNHSIPDSFALVIDTQFGKIVHTGDFKFDFTPIGPETEYHKLSYLGHSKDVVCLLSDSTNSGQSGFTLSEKKVEKSMNEMFSYIKGRIIVATFASNIHRVSQIVKASVKAGRKIAIFGRSMDNTIRIGRELKYINAPRDTFVYPSTLKNLPPEKVTILCTGSQGEPLAALSRIANGSHKQISIRPNDTVIFSSSPIPGNALSINNTINQLAKAGADVITHNPFNDTHTSGHATQEELKFMIQLLKPKYFMPIHGEYSMLKQHASLALECGMKETNCFVMDNGQVLSITKQGASLDGTVTSGIDYVSANIIGGIGKNIIRERQKLSDDGLIIYMANFSAKSRALASKSIIETKGFPLQGDYKMMSNIRRRMDNKLLHLLQNNSNNKNNSLLNIKELLEKDLFDIVYDITKKRPLIIPIIIPV